MVQDTDAESAGSDSAEASATPILSADGSHGCPDGGGPIQPSHSHITADMETCRTTQDTCPGLTCNLIRIRLTDHTEV